MPSSTRSSLGRNLACVAALGALSIYWLAQAQSSTDDAARFTGVSRALEADGWRVSRRSFEAGARTAWHRHSGGQVLFVERGRMRLQDRGKAIRELGVGDSHYTAGGIEHWHGATPDSELTQVAMSRGDADATAWLDKVTDAEYSAR
jgi:quercetin dioxygenase-like cupin family protein